MSVEDDQDQIAAIPDPTSAEAQIVSGAEGAELETLRTHLAERLASADANTLEIIDYLISGAHKKAIVALKDLRSSTSDGQEMAAAASPAPEPPDAGRNNWEDRMGRQRFMPEIRTPLKDEDALAVFTELNEINLKKGARSNPS